MSTFPENFYWGETVRGTVARGCLLLCEVTSNSSDNLNRCCKQRQRGTVARGCLLLCEVTSNSSDNLNRCCKQRQRGTVARGCLLFWNKNIDNLNRCCNQPAPPKDNNV